MNFEFSEDQFMLRDQARKFLAETCSPSLVRGSIDDDQPYDADLWQGIVDMGWLGAAIPEEYGGLGLTSFELAMIAHELGRAVAPVPYSSSIYLAAQALILAGSEQQKAHWLPKLADGSVIGTLAFHEGVGESDAATVLADGTLTGTKYGVPDGSTARLCIVAARSGDKHEAGLFLVDLSQEGASAETLSTIDMSRDHATLTFDRAEAEQLGSTDADGSNLLDQLLDRAAVLFAWEQLGSAEMALEMARDYSLERYAFGRPIGSYQALKHRMALMFAANELARSNCYYAAMALESSDPCLPVAAAAARISATQALNLSSKENIQIHGGMGFTWEIDCHLHFRRARLLAVNLGSELVWKRRLMAAIDADRAIEART